MYVHLEREMEETADLLKALFKNILNSVGGQAKEDLNAEKEAHKYLKSKFEKMENLLTSKNLKLQKDMEVLKIDNSVKDTNKESLEEEILALKDKCKNLENESNKNYSLYQKFKSRCEELY